MDRHTLLNRAIRKCCECNFFFSGLRNIFFFTGSTFYEM